MAESVRDRDLRRLLDVIEAARGTDVPCGFPAAVLERASALVACDSLAFIETEPANHLTVFGQAWGDDSGDAEPGEDVFWRHYGDSLPCTYPEMSGDARSVTTISDFYTQRQWHNTGMYGEYFSCFGIEHEAMVCLSAPAGRSRRLIFFRRRGADFDARDRLLLSLLRPHLDALYQELELRRRRNPDLTPRQWELLQLVASGYSNAEIASELVVSKDTVRKHMENIFERLNVTSRTAAVAQAFPSAPY